MIIFRNNMRRLLRDRYNLIVMVILPVVTLALYWFAGSNTTVRVGVTDNDDTFLTESLISGLEKNCMVLFLKDEEIKYWLLNDEIDYGIKIDKGFTESIISGKEARIKAYGIRDYNGLIPAKTYIDNFINSARKIAIASEGQEEFKKGLEQYIKGIVEVEYEDVSYASSGSSYAAESGLGVMIMFMMYMGINAASLMGEDKRLKTYERILMSPLTLKEYALGNIFSFFAIIWIQIFALFGILKYLFRLDFGSQTGSLLIFTIIYSAVCVYMGMAIVNLSKNLSQVSALTPLIVVPMAMLGGCIWPREIMPAMFQRISELVPVTWAMKGIEKILNGGSITAAYNEIIVLLLFSLVFFLVGSGKINSYA